MRRTSNTTTERTTLPVIVLSFAGVLFSTCAPTPEEQVQELGFYAVVEGEAQVLSERTKNSTQEWDPSAWPRLRLETDDHILVYGPMPEGSFGTGVTVGRWVSEKEHWTQEEPLDSYFQLLPQEPLRGQNLLKLAPRGGLTPGEYKLFRFIGFNDTGSRHFHFVTKNGRSRQDLEQEAERLAEEKAAEAQRKAEVETAARRLTEVQALQAMKNDLEAAEAAEAEARASSRYSPEELEKLSRDWFSKKLELESNLRRFIEEHREAGGDPKDPNQLAAIRMMSNEAVQEARRYVVAAQSSRFKEAIFERAISVCAEALKLDPENEQLKVTMEETQIALRSFCSENSDLCVRTH